VPNKSSIILIQQDLKLLQILEKILESHGYTYSSTSSLKEAYSLINDCVGQIVLLCDQIPEEKGRELLHYIDEVSDVMKAIIIASKPSIPGAIAAVKEGAVDYIGIHEINDRFLPVVQTVDRKIRQELAQSSERTGREDNPSGIVGKSKALHIALERSYKAAESRETVLITGESGTGKELIARVIHHQTARSGDPFIPVNCGGIPANLLESELFGHVKGAYTGAGSTTKGYFQAADTGTIFLDEISNTSKPMQAKLLRVLESHEVWKVGIRRPDKIDVRVIAASNENLRRLVKERKFRKDLFYRLNVIAIRMPPLRERRSDIEALCNYFANQQARELDKEPPTFSEEVLEIFHRHDWPGNVRELKNLVKRIVVLADHPTVMVSDLPQFMQHTESDCFHNQKSLIEVERSHIQKIMEEVDWNISQAAKILGVSRQTLYNRLNQFNLQRPTVSYQTTGANNSV